MDRCLGAVPGKLLSLIYDKCSCTKDKTGWLCPKKISQLVFIYTTGNFLTKTKGFGPRIASSRCIGMYGQWKLRWDQRSTRMEKPGSLAGQGPLVDGEKNFENRDWFSLRLARWREKFFYRPIGVVWRYTGRPKRSGGVSRTNQYCYESYSYPAPGQVVGSQEN
jgi:hypothetical protein